MASMEPVSSWNSNSVLSVMELTKEPMIVVPKNYIRPDQELSASSDYSTLTTIPTIDMKKLALGETSDLELEKLHSTCKAWGLIQVLLNFLDYLYTGLPLNAAAIWFKKKKKKKKETQHIIMSSFPFLRQKLKFEKYPKIFLYYCYIVGEPWS